MAPRDDTLRDLIADYRRRLHEGVIGSEALREIDNAATELEELEAHDRHAAGHEVP